MDLLHGSIFYFESSKIPRQTLSSIWPFNPNMSAIFYFSFFHARMRTERSSFSDGWKLWWWWIIQWWMCASGERDGRERSGLVWNISCAQCIGIFARRCISFDVHFQLPGRNFSVWKWPPVTTAGKNCIGFAFQKLLMLLHTDYVSR